MGIEKGLTDARSHPSVLQDGLFRVRLFRLVFSGSFFDQLLRFATLIHFDHDITTADQLAVNPQLREGRPVSIFRQFRTNVRILQNINIGKTFATCGKRLDCLAEKPQLGSFGEPFMYSRIGFSAIWRWIFSIVVLIVLLPQTSLRQ